jgi:hypothetical protein
MNQDWMKYAALGSQFFLGIGLMLVAGWKLDGWLDFQTPLLIWFLPLLFITSMLVKLIVETNRKRK